MSYPKYPEYKDSGISWLGQIPSHWDVVRVKHIAEFSTGWTPPTEREELYNGPHPWVNISDLGPRVISQAAKSITDKAIIERGAKAARKGSLLFSFKLSVGTVSIAGKDLYTNEAIAAFFPSPILNTDYFYWAAPVFIPHNAQENIFGSPLLNRERIENAFVLRIPIEEQYCINIFLEKETEKIDSLLKEQYNLINSLKEKRQALISQAVTKGLDPSVPMKDSGIPWLGRIPAHWMIQRLKTTVAQAKNGVWGNEPLQDSNDIECVRVADFDRSGLVVKQDIPTVRNVPPSERVGRTLQQGDLLLEKSGGGESQPVGCVVLYDRGRPAVCSNFVSRLTVADGYEPSFLRYLHAFIYATGLNKRSIKQTSGIQNLDQQQYLDEPVPLPPATEQQQISLSLDKSLFGIDALIGEQEGLIENLNERRTALISAAVTGQIDVRNLSVHT